MSLTGHFHPCPSTFTFNPHHAALTVAHQLCRAHLRPRLTVPNGLPFLPYFKSSCVQLFSFLCALSHSYHGYLSSFMAKRKDTAGNLFKLNDYYFYFSRIIFSHLDTQKIFLLLLFPILITCSKI